MSAADAEETFTNTRTVYGRFLRKKKTVLSGSGRVTTRK